jgi:hypothetical protein
MMSLAGGEEQFNDMLAWANENLTPGEQKAYNDAVLSEGSAEFAIQGLYARYRQAAGAPNFVNTQNTPASTNGAYQSQREMMVDMANPKYHKDPAFRKMVQQKVARSKF